MTNQFYIQSVSELIFYFAGYAFIGWLIENTFNLLTNGKFLKGNFLIGPFKPMYGLTPILLIFLIKTNMNIFSILMICYFVPLGVEYLTGFVLLKVFRLRYWDYSSLRCQFQGHICLLFSLFWLVLSVVLIKWLHPLTGNFYQSIEPYWKWFYISVIVYFLIDILTSSHMHLRNRYEHIKLSISK